MATDTFVRTTRADAAPNLSIRVAHGYATATVDPAATAVTVTLRPLDVPPLRLATDAECVAQSAMRRAVAQTRVTEGGGLLAVDVPPTARVRVEIVLPPAAHLIFRTRGANLATEGLIGALEFTSHSGRLDADRVAVLRGATVAGEIRARAVTEIVHATTETGRVDVEHFDGRLLRVKSTTGDVHAYVERAASPAGEIDIDTAGTVDLTGHHAQLRNRNVVRNAVPVAV
jgi:hypothetical protein